MNTCDICGRIFRRKDNMLRHKRNVHHLEKETSDNSDTDQSLSEVFDATESDNEEEAVDIGTASYKRRLSDVKYSLRRG